VVVALPPGGFLFGRFLLCGVGVGVVPLLVEIRLLVDIRSRGGCLAFLLLVVVSAAASSIGIGIGIGIGVGVGVGFGARVGAARAAFAAVDSSAIGPAATAPPKGGRPLP